ncbi:AbiTii domain-containing protein [Mycolicibacter arupensis]|uniref:AbiTii domain-containing protein n=1 Tax=Mycolicibacter arupensis TaxID=342002 RepID=UPI00122D3A3E|nr:hypothetical protein [Mycolicibacter arupensis]KAA1428621.1 hypothetical protein F0402_19015 [Mycolicibacter arupensis]
MADADILKDLRDQVLDESEPLVGLLRKCLALGAITGSDELRSWASGELKGYEINVPIPEYRRLHAQLLVDSTSGPTSTRRERVSLLQVPTDLRRYIPEALDLRQPIEELAEMAAREKPVNMAGEGFSVAAALWTQQLGNMFQKIDALYYSVLPSTIAGVVGMVRTTLVEIVIDLAKDVPLDSLPTRDKVDAAVQVHINSNDNNSINVAGGNTGVIGQGAGSTQIQNNTVPTELTDIITKMREALADIHDPDQRADAEQAIDDFDEAVSESKPEPEKIKRRSRALERVTTAIVGGALSQLAKDGVGLALEHFQLLV